MAGGGGAHALITRPRRIATYRHRTDRRPTLADSMAWTSMLLLGVLATMASWPLTQADKQDLTRQEPNAKLQSLQEEILARTKVVVSQAVAIVGSLAADRVAAAPPKCEVEACPTQHAADIACEHPCLEYQVVDMFPSMK
jgi:hypothetical protein